ncbi:MAG: putative signal transducing protein [Alphaproteobacteria bacterium]
MREILRTNDVVKLSWVQALLADAGIETVLLDVHTSIIEGSIGAIPRRLMVIDEDYAQAIRILQAAGEDHTP